MKAWQLAVASWLLTALIGFFGLQAWYTIWYYQEPVIDTVSQPGSSIVAVVSGLGLFALSFLFSCAMTVFAGRVASNENRHEGSYNKGS